jgi:putative pyruvate formate lyase activating enzyme
VDRSAGERGFCGAGNRARVASFGPHHGEERPLVGTGGSGTVFFSHCSLGCVFCQNSGISHGGVGEDVTAKQLAGMMARLQEMGCHNVNLVTPTHFLPQILEALVAAAEMGCRLPLAYNSSGYESVTALRVLDGIVDIYMPDAKFAAPETARRLCQAPDYPERMVAALTEMHRQVGDLVVDGQGLARRGLLVRHLVMPGQLTETAAIMGLIAAVSPDTHVNVMPQYRPSYRAEEVPGISRRVATAEYREALAVARRAGLTRLDER